MYRGIVIGIVIGAACLVCFELLLGSPLFPAERTVAEMKAEVDQDDVALARVNPEAALEQLDIKSFPAFIAFLDLDMAITDASLEPYKNIFEQVAGYYSSDTPMEIVEAVFRIYETQEYFYTLTYRESLEYIQDTVPVDFDLESESGHSAKRVRVAADEIHDLLVAAYFQPQVDALAQQRAEQAQLQQRIQSNINDIRARGASEAVMRDRTQKAQNQYMQRNLTYHYNDYNNRYRRGRSIRRVSVPHIQ